jgi:hypothetical protein
MIRTKEKFFLKMFYLCSQRPLAKMEVKMMVEPTFEIVEKDALEDMIIEMK